MDKGRFEEFFRRHKRREELVIEPEKLEAIISKLLSESHLDLWYMEKTEKGDVAAVSIDRLDRDVVSLVRIRDSLTAVDREDLEDLYDDMVEEEAREGIYITTFHFTKEAREYAEDMPIKLVDGVKLGALLEEYVALPEMAAFLSSKTDREVIEYFDRGRKRRTLGVIGAEESIVEIDRRYIPLAIFSLPEEKANGGKGRKVYVDLHRGDILYIDERDIKRRFIVGRILDQPEESREHLLDLVKYGRLERKHMEGKHLSILEKEGLVRSHKKAGGEKSVLEIVSDDLSDTASLISQEVKDLSSIKSSTPTTIGGRRPVIHGEDYVFHTLKIPTVDESYDLGNFIESGSRDERFDPDTVNYSKDDVLEVLEKLYGEGVSFEGMIYLPYYRCEYKGLYRVRHKDLLAPKFNELIPEKTGFYEVYKLIDEAPVVPYVGISLAYIIYQWGNLDHVIHVFSSAFIFFIVSCIIGLILKVIFRTERRVPRYGGPILKYGFPSIHTMTSIGAVSFVYFINPLFALMLLPLGLLYLYSRLKLGVHEMADVVGGSSIGLIIGALCGHYIYMAPPLDRNLEMILAVLFLIVPIMGNMISSKLR